MGRTNDLRADILIVGAGITGCSIAYHLAQLGHKNVVVVDRGTVEDPLGSTGHAPGLLGRNSGSSALAAIADYTANLFARLPEDDPAFECVGSVEVARDQEGLSLLRRKAKAAHRHGFSARMVGPEELASLVPYMDVSSVVGGIFLPDDGVLDARRALRALHQEGATLGVRFLENTEVFGFGREGGRICGVVTERGPINAERVVVAVGIWGAALLAKIGVDLPLLPVQHPYVYTAPLEVLGSPHRQATRPIVRDLDNLFYLREHGDRLGYGWYNHEPATADAGELGRADLPFPESGFLEAVDHALFPLLSDTPIDRRLNGVFSMTPDGGPLLGELPEHPGLWVAEAVWVTHSAGIGLVMAELLLGRESTVNVAEFGPDRFSSMNLSSRRRASLKRYNDIYAWPAELDALK